MAELRSSVCIPFIPVSELLGMEKPGLLTALKPDYLTDLFIAFCLWLVMIVGKEEGEEKSSSLLGNHSYGSFFAFDLI